MDDPIYQPGDVVRMDVDFNERPDGSISVDCELYRVVRPVVWLIYEVQTLFSPAIVKRALTGLNSHKVAYIDQEGDDASLP